MISRLWALLWAVTLLGCSHSDNTRDGRIVVKYWEKWTGFEGEAMRAVVEDFNASQDRIFVEYLTVSQIDRKMMLATAGGNPPDLAGIWSWAIPVYAENNALTPLDKLAREARVTRSDYIDVFWQICSHRGHLWALPTTPASTALHWNKRLFREAGLDPEKPPRSIAELEELNEKLLQRRSDGSIKVIGHLPLEPGWWATMWGYWFGGALWDGKNAITANSPENLAAYEWMQSYPKRFGVENILSFRDAFGNFASPQNAFFTERVAMVLQGVWMYNFIQNYAPPGFEWGVAPFSSVDPVTLQDVTIVECDALVIPSGARHPKEAFEFIRYVNSQGPMEKLCLGQRKFSPLRETSAEFIANHPNPYIEEFIALARSPNARYVPRLTIWTEYQNNLNNAVGRVWTLKATPREALDDVQQRMQKVFARKEARWKRVEAERLKEWSHQ